jgi:hypothetical protein
VVHPTETERAEQRFGGMKLFYIHVLNGTDYARDPEGQQFADIAAAYQSARNGARSLVSEEILACRDPVKLEYRICDETGTQLAVLAVGATVSGLG